MSPRLWLSPLFCMAGGHLAPGQPCASSAWQLIGASPGARGSPALVYDSLRHRIVMWGGGCASPQCSPSVIYVDTWAWDGAAWTQIAAKGLPVGRSAKMAYDAARDRIVLFGGANGTLPPFPFYFDETWLFDGQQWTRANVSGPSARFAHGMAYDAARQRVVLFGGYKNYASYNDTWEWDGKAWHLRSVGGPSKRYGHAMAYDPVRGRIVLHGGNDPAPEYLSDTWEWDGSRWTLLARTGTPPREFHEMVFDERRGAVVLFGGRGWNASHFDDTWTWDGSGWQQLAAWGPSARFDYGMAYDVKRERVVMYGGFWYSCCAHQYFDEVWELGCGCYADCDTSSSLTVADFGCFQTKFVAADPYADCNGDGVLTVQDYSCFQTRFITGCP